ncbi:hypothetical protein CJ030_MR0G021688 [Morella rubra]|uniref:Uncharacterized protein n=1 Tax=Morella rubra TaxID=262757 RepID=A0A6A1UGW6_9ROSI|nr:hypothetical protein CJ030_MR0G021688 [Morella rubra]
MTFDLFVDFWGYDMIPLARDDVEPNYIALSLAGQVRSRRTLAGAIEEDAFINDNDEFEEHDSNDDDNDGDNDNVGEETDIMGSNDETEDNDDRQGNGGETMANRAKRQRAVAPCLSSPPPVYNDVLVPVMPTPTPSTSASGDFETRASSQPTLAPSLGATSNSGRRGRTHGLALDKVQATQLNKLSVSIPYNCAADVGENSTKLST